MTGYLMRLAVRSTRTAGGLRPRAVSLFEAAPPAVELAPADAGTPSAPAPSALPPTPPVAPARPAAEGPFPTLPVGPPRAIAGETAVVSTTAPSGAVATAQAATRPTTAAVRPGPAARTGDRAPTADLAPADVTTRQVQAPPAAPGRVDAVPERGRPTAPRDDVVVRAPDAPLAAPADPTTDGVVLPRLHPGPPPVSPAPEVKVSIGRIEVVAAPPAGPHPDAPATPATPPARSAPRRATGAPTLVDYLRDRSRR